MRFLHGSARRSSRSEPDTRGRAARRRLVPSRGEARIGAPLERPQDLVAEHHLGDLLEVVPLEDGADAWIEEQRRARLAGMRRAVRKGNAGVFLRGEVEDLLGALDADPDLQEV